MNKRAFLKRLFATLAGLPLASRGARAAPRTVLLQESPLAGFQYYDGERLWPRLAAGQAVELRRNPRNPHDDRAVEIWRAGHMLGHLPRVENTAVAQMLDRGEPLTARITTLNQSRGPWERIRLAVYWDPSAPAPAPAPRAPDERDRRRYWVREWPQAAVRSDPAARPGPMRAASRSLAKVEGRG